MNHLIYTYNYRSILSSVLMKIQRTKIYKTKLIDQWNYANLTLLPFWRWKYFAWNEKLRYMLGQTGEMRSSRWIYAFATSKNFFSIRCGGKRRNEIPRFLLSLSHSSSLYFSTTKHPSRLWTSKWRSHGTASRPLNDHGKP